MRSPPLQCALPLCSVRFSSVSRSSPCYVVLCNKICFGYISLASHFHCSLHSQLAQRTRVLLNSLVTCKTHLTCLTTRLTLLSVSTGLCSQIIDFVATVHSRLSSTVDRAPTSLEHHHNPNIFPTAFSTPSQLCQLLDSLDHGQSCPLTAFSPLDLSTSRLTPRPSSLSRRHLSTPSHTSFTYLQYTLSTLAHPYS